MIHAHAPVPTMHLDVDVGMQNFDFDFDCDCCSSNDSLWLCLDAQHDNDVSGFDCKGMGVGSIGTINMPQPWLKMGAWPRSGHMLMLGVTAIVERVINQKGLMTEMFQYSNSNSNNRHGIGWWKWNVQVQVQLQLACWTWTHKSQVVSCGCGSTWKGMRHESAVERRKNTMMMVVS